MIAVEASDLGRVASALRSEMPEVLPLFRAEMRATMSGAVAAARSGAMGIRMASEAGGAPPARAVRRAAPRSSAATSARARVAAGHTRSLAEAAATGKRHVRSERQWDRLVDRERLRMSLAAGIHAETRTSAGRMSLEVRTRHAPAFLTSRSSLRSFRNYGRWRHPVFGDRETWVYQSIVNPMWWDDALEPHVQEALAAAGDAMEKWQILVDDAIDKAGRREGN